MSDFDHSFSAALQAGHQHEFAQDRVPHWVEAFNIAIAADRLDEALLARYYYILDATPFEPDGVVVAFVWCSAHLEHDRFVSPSRFASLYGTITRLLYEDPKYPIDQIEQTWIEMSRRFDEFGFHRRRYVYHRLYHEIAVANDDGVRQMYTELESLDGRDKQICQWATTQDVHVYFNEHERALDYGYRVIRSGDTCDHNHPTVVRFENLIPLLELNQLDEAKQQFAVAERRINDMHNNRMWCVGRAIFYLACIGDLDRGEDYFADCYKLVRSGGSPADHYRFFSSARPFLRRCLEDGHDASRMLEQVNHAGDLEGLLNQITAEVFDVARAFDQRHQNSWYCDMLERHNALYDRIKKSTARKQG